MVNECESTNKSTRVMLKARDLTVCLQRAWWGEWLAGLRTGSYNQSSVSGCRSGRLLLVMSLTFASNVESWTPFHEAIQ
jgi:hypothetical protein